QLSVVSQHLPVVCSSAFLKVGFPFWLFPLKMSLSFLSYAVSYKLAVTSFIRFSDQFIYFLIPTHN
ncbi:MAG: hypothetical protein ACKPH1_22160, partial [Microcystis panniformis]